MALSASSKSAAQRWLTKYGPDQATKSCAAGFRGRHGADRDFPTWCSEVFGKPWGKGATGTTSTPAPSNDPPPPSSADTPTVSDGGVTRDGDTVSGTSSAYGPSTEAPTTGRGLIDELTGPPSSGTDVQREFAPAGQTTFSTGGQARPAGGTTTTTAAKPGEAKKSGGLPWWAWVGGGVAALALLAGKRKKRRRW